MVELSGIEASRSPASGTRRDTLSGGRSRPRTPQEVDGSGFQRGGRCATGAERVNNEGFLVRLMRELIKVEPTCPGRGARSLPEGRSLAPRERERGRDQARGRGPLAEPRAGGEARSRASGSDGIGGAERDRTVPLSLRSGRDAVALHGQGALPPKTPDGGRRFDPTVASKRSKSGDSAR